MTGKTTDFTLAIFANIPTSSEKGCLVHIGAADGSDGYSLGIGGTTFDNVGNNLIFEACPNQWTVLGPIGGTGWKHLAAVVDGAGAVAGLVDGIHSYTFDIDTTAWAAAVVTAGGGPVSYGRKLLIDSLIIGLKADGIWTKLDRLWIFAAEDSQSALIDLVALDSATATNSPTFTPDLGYACNAVANVITNYVPSTHGVNFTSNSAHVSAWYSSLAQNGNMSTGMAGGGSQTHIYARFTDDNCYARVNSSAVGGFANATTASQHIIANRSGPSNTEGYRNGTSMLTGTAGTVGLDTTALYAHSQPTAMMSVGGSLNSTQATAYYNRLRTYMNGTLVP